MPRKSKEPKGPRPDKKCLFCGYSIPPGAGGRRLYCNDAHKVAYHRKLKANNQPEAQP